MKADGKIKDCHITHRQYLSDAAFGVLLEGACALIERINSGLANPVWGIWLGRKTCIPTAPVLSGITDTREDALQMLIGDTPIESLTRQEDVENFADGRDSLPDTPVSFASAKRMFSPRRVKTTYAK
jgi:CRISPR system Cascade subunit CasD